MYLTLADLITPSLLVELRAGFASAALADGRSSAGFAARSRKQLKRAALAPELLERVADALKEHALLRLSVRPSAFSPLCALCYRVGDHYGWHLDDVRMGRLRTDVAFTLFIDSPNAYDGGELDIDDPSGRLRYKLDAGAALVYPASHLHAVAPVTRGERRVIVGWIQSEIRDPAQRALLLDLELARRELHLRDADDPINDRLHRATSNLLRMWLD
jgi:PKHD-type hydroxylase